MLERIWFPLWSCELWTTTTLTQTRVVYSTIIIMYSRCFYTPYISIWCWYGCCIDSKTNCSNTGSCCSTKAHISNVLHTEFLNGVYDMVRISLGMRVFIHTVCYQFWIVVAVTAQYRFFFFFGLVKTQYFDGAQPIDECDVEHSVQNIAN